MNRIFKLVTIFFLGIVLIHLSSQTIYNCSPTASCGCSANSAILTKIVGGEAASSGTWGWAASLHYSSTGSLFCGGSIISNYHILTAAHCTVGLSSPSSVVVYVGSIDLNSPAQIRDVSIIFIHPDFSQTTYVNDISILKLSSSLNLGQSGVDIICLPNVSSIVLASEEYPAPNTNLIAIGWGTTSEGGSISQILQQVTVQAIAATSIYCQNSQIADASEQLCAGVMPNGGKDTCQGDSGGALMMFNSESVWEQVGITSYGPGCAEAYRPGVYTRVAAYQSWINDTINNGNHVRGVVHTILISLGFLILL